jgi:dihydrodipicolinate synthase/N-acetylneuraminate lyase
MKADWRGVLPAATTQFRADGALDIGATLTHLDAMIAAGVHGLIMLGTVGENCSLEPGEKIELVAATVRHVAGRVPVLSGVAEYTTALACRWAEQAARAGVDGLMVLPAMVYKADRRETIAHFRAVARATALPIMCYNNPVSYGVDMLPDAFCELADEPTLVAIKESSENPRRITDLVNACGDRYLLLMPFRTKTGCCGIFSRRAGLTKPGVSIAGIRPCCTSTRIPSWCSTSSWPPPPADTAAR